MPSVNHTIEIYPEPHFDFSTNDLQGCSPLVVDMDLQTDSNYTYNWQVGNGSTSVLPEPQFVLTTPGQFDVTLTGTTSKGCKATILKRKYLNVFANPTAQFVASPKIALITAPIINFLNSSLNAQFYVWDFGDSTTSNYTNESHTYSKVGTYEITLIATNSGGCVDTTRGTIEINEGMEFFIPNSFTPNGDGVNDFFQGYGINIKSVEMSIYDRWGKKIYETSENYKPWDGRVKEVVQNDVYVYRFLVTDKLDQQHSYVGSVTVVR
jgi:gliding motility-associated-like protein